MLKLQNEMPCQISIRKILLLIGILAMTLAILAQIGMGTARFEVSENDLQLDDRQLVSGELKWWYSGTETLGEHPWPFVCQIRNVDNQRLLKIQPGQTNEVRSRARPIWPFKKQDAFKIYIARDIGIPANRIVGFVMTSEGTEVVIDGNN